MESSKKGHRLLTESGSATVVQYDLTSSEEELYDDQSYLYCSATKLSPPPQCWQEGYSQEEQGESSVDASSSQDSESSEEEDGFADRTTRAPPVIDLSSAESESSEKEQGPGRSKRPRLIDVASTKSSLEITAPGPAPGDVITISSCSEDEQKPKSATPSRKPYALAIQDLPAELRRFLSEARSFFTRAHSLERHGQQVALSTYMKAEERVLCKYFTFTLTSILLFSLSFFFLPCGFKLTVAAQIRKSQVDSFSGLILSLIKHGPFILE